jgi:hypothetical protein
VPVPTFDPDRRTRAGLPRPDCFNPGERVWVYRAGAWRPGVVLHSSAQAVTVRYRPADGRGTGVDTVTAHSLASRDDEDPFLDVSGLDVSALDVPSRDAVAPQDAAS